MKKNTLKNFKYYVRLHLTGSETGLPVRDFTRGDDWSIGSFQSSTFLGKIDMPTGVCLFLEYAGTIFRVFYCVAQRINVLSVFQGRDASVEGSLPPLPSGHWWAPFWSAAGSAPSSNAYNTCTSTGAPVAMTAISMISRSPQP